MDCPEKGHPFSRKANRSTSETIFGKVVEIHRMDTDRYERTMALVAVDKQLLNEELVKAGYARVYDSYCSGPICGSCKSFQLRAKFSRKGIWSEPNPVPP